MKLSIKFLLAISVLSFGCSGIENRSVDAKNPTKFWWQAPSVASDIATVQTKSSWLVNTDGLVSDDFPCLTTGDILVFPDNWSPQTKVDDSKTLRQDARSFEDLLDEARKRLQKSKPEEELY